MAEVQTDRRVNPSQLAAELGGGVALNVVGPDQRGSWIVRADVPDAHLDAAVRAHVADPAWRDPNPPPEPPDAADARRLGELRERARARTITAAERNEAIDLALRLGRL